MKAQGKAEIKQRLITAVVTPFDNNGAIDYESFRSLLQHLYKTGISAFLVNGTTGEGMSTTKEEKVENLLTAIESLDDDCEIIANTEGSYTDEIGKEIKVYEKLGLSTVMVVVPYYVKPSQAGIIKHYRTLADMTSMNIIVYENPSRTGTKLDENTVLALSEIENIIAIKDSSGGMKLVQRTLTATDKLQFFCGNDDLILPSLAVGVHGSVSVISQIFPEPLVALHDNLEFLERSDFIKARDSLQSLISLIDERSAIAAVKYILRKEGLIASDNVRLPLLTIDESIDTLYDGYVAFKKLYGVDTKRENV
jgi:4-hydroxy-tetrahydrodipicolinate synthase